MCPGLPPHSGGMFVHTTTFKVQWVRLESIFTHFRCIKWIFQDDGTCIYLTHHLMVSVWDVVNQCKAPLDKPKHIFHPLLNISHFTHIGSCKCCRPIEGGDVPFQVWQQNRFAGNKYLPRLGYNRTKYHLSTYFFYFYFF